MSTVNSSVHATSPATAARPLPSNVSGTRSPAWWGMIFFITTEATLFAALVSSYFYLASGAPVWPPDGIKPPDLFGPILGTVLLLSSSAPIIGGEQAIKRGDRRGLLLGWGIALLLATVFIGLQIHEYTKEEFSIRTNQYGSLFFSITGLHVLHVMGALLMNLFVLFHVLGGRVTKNRHLAVETVGIYWHFVGVVWIVVFTSLYIIPHFL